MDASVILATILGYLIGSIPFTQVVAKTVKSIDLREVGSRNVGGRNLIRQLGPGWGLLGGGLDVLKGTAAMAIGFAWLGPDPLSMLPGVAAVVGHNWPVWLGFRGGKGLSAALGVMLYIAPLQSLAAFLVSLLLVRLTGNILLTALAGFITILLLVSVAEYPPQVTSLVWGLFVVVLLAALPDVLHKLRTAGGVGEYMRNPNKVYEEEARTKKPASRKEPRQ
jgi:glycerol-3-phosphate acyltransferase PlsY